MMAGGLYLAPYFEEPDDSGIDSDDAGQEREEEEPGVEFIQMVDMNSSDDDAVAVCLRNMKRILDQQMLSESGSSDEELVLSTPPRSRKLKFNDQLINMEEDEQAEREVLIPMVTWQRPGRDCPDFHSLMLESPDCSSPPLYEVELTASDEEDDTSVMELVIPVQSSRFNRVPTSAPSKAYMAIRVICNLLCCFRNFN